MLTILDLVFLYVLWILVPFIWYLLLKIANLSFLKFNIPTFVLISIIIINYIGYPYLFYATQFGNEVMDLEILTRSWLINILSITLMIFGFIFAKILHGKILYYDVKSEHKFLNNYQKLILFIFLMICIFVLFLYVDKLGFQNLALFQSSYYEKNFFRSIATNDFDGKIHRYNFFIRDFFGIVFMTILCEAFTKGKAKIYYFIALFVGFLFVFGALISLEKAPILRIIMMVFLSYIIVKNSSEISLKKIAFIVLVFFTTLVLFYIYLIGGSDAEQSFFSALRRVFVTQIIASCNYLIIFPDYENWLLGRSFPSPGGIFTFDQYLLTKEVHLYVQHFAGIENSNTIVGSVPAVYWSDMYANFGYFGVIGSSIFIGYFVYAINNIIIKYLPINSFTIAIFITILIHYQKLSITHASSYFIDVRLMIYFILIIIVSLKFGKKTYN